MCKFNIKIFDYYHRNKYTIGNDMKKSLKRDPVKYVRDRMKSRYKPKEPCYICGAVEDIELHHLYSVAELWNSWIKRNKIKIETDEDVIFHRDVFERENEEYLNNSNLYSLCRSHHSKLHSIYGKSYSNYMGKRVKDWLERQKIR